MLRLWPERRTIGLFPDACWIAPAGGDMPIAATVAGHAPDALLAALEGMLTHDGKAWRKGTAVDVLVSDRVAAVTALPWQAQLQRPDELRNYALLCLEQQGIRLDADWIVHTEYRHYQATGLAYALPRSWLTQLLALLQQQHLRLGTVLPISAAGYAAMHGTPAGRSLLLLNEAVQLTALLFNDGKLHAIDREPVTGMDAQAGQRLLARIAAQHGDIARAWTWLPAMADHKDSAAKESAAWVQDSLPRTILKNAPAGLRRIAA